VRPGAPPGIVHAAGQRPGVDVVLDPGGVTRLGEYKREDCRLQFVDATIAIYQRGLGPLVEVPPHLEWCGVALAAGSIARSGALGRSSSASFRDPKANLVEAAVHDCP
jgi:hypothetical protein